MERIGRAGFVQIAMLAAVLSTATPLGAQMGDVASLSDEVGARELAAAAVDALVMVPMRDGVSLASYVFRPKRAAGPLPTILSKTP